jgi:cyclopropane-fatty-acyl-phospholipid synthase
MSALASLEPTALSRALVTTMLAAVTSGYRLRLDFSDGYCAFIGPESDRVSFGIRPPALWQTLWILFRPGLRAGEGFARGYWDVTEGNLPDFIKILQVPRKNFYSNLYWWLSAWRGPFFWLRQYIFPTWDRGRVANHYELGDELYDNMLDSKKQYSCGFFNLAHSEDLEDAQARKIEVSIERLQLVSPGLKVLDIGCGWGALAATIARQPGGHEVVGISLSKDQIRGALVEKRKLSQNTQGRLDFRREDYRTFLVNRSFDRIISIGMFEHVGLRYHRHFYRLIEGSLSKDGLALIHSIVRPQPGSYNEWIRRHIFPGSFIPSMAEFLASAEREGLIVDAVYVHPPSDYRKTLQAWRQRFESSWPMIHQSNPVKYDEHFRRTWLFYLASMEATFTEDLSNFRIAQVVLRKLSFANMV